MCTLEYSGRTIVTVKVYGLNQMCAIPTEPEQKSTQIVPIRFINQIISQMIGSCVYVYRVRAAVSFVLLLMLVV